MLAPSALDRAEEGGDKVVKEVLDHVLGLAKELSSADWGALIVVAPRDAFAGHYECHFPQVVGAANVLEEGSRAVIERLATLDGAILLATDGTLVAYGARITKPSTLTGYGTRHSAAKGATEVIPGATAVLVSEESGWIKVFQQGAIVLETDASDVPAPFQRRLASFLVDHDLTVLATAGLSAATLVSMGVGPLSILVVGGTYVIVRSTLGAISAVLGIKDRRT